MTDTGAQQQAFDRDSKLAYGENLHRSDTIISELRCRMLVIPSAAVSEIAKGWFTIWTV